jgi:hypothetical protein
MDDICISNSEFQLQAQQKFYLSIWSHIKLAKTVTFHGIGS